MNKIFTGFSLYIGVVSSRLNWQFQSGVKKTGVSGFSDSQPANRIEQAMQSLRPTRQGCQVAALPNFSHSVVKTPNRFAISTEFLVGRRAPLFEDSRNLSDR